MELAQNQLIQFFLNQQTNKKIDETKKLESQKMSKFVPRITKNFRVEEILEVFSVTWSNPNFDLFDFHRFGHQMQRFQLKSSATLGYTGEQVTVLSSTDKEDDFDYTVRFEIKSGAFVLKSQESPTKPQYVLVRSLVDKGLQSQRGYILRAGDDVRFGRVEFRISEMQCWDKRGDNLVRTNGPERPDQKQEGRVMDITEQADSIRDKQEKTLSGAKGLTCRYCLMESIAEDQVEDMLVHPCNCRGGLKYVHIYCLKRWIQEKMTVKKTQAIAIYERTSMRCEMCQAKWPRSLKYQQQTVDLFAIPKPETPYMIFERIGEDIEKKTVRMVLHNNGSPVGVGAGSNNPFRVKDASVDDKHAKFEIGANNQFLVKDLESQFGTLVKLKVDWNIGFRKESIQVGRTVFSMIKRHKKIQKI